MRLAPAAAIAVAVIAMPLLAQDAAPSRGLDQRVGILEKEMRAVQRKVFPGGTGSIVEPEIAAGVPGADAGGIPATTPLNDLTGRVDSLERGLATLTGQVEQNQFKVRQLEEAMTKLRADTEYRLSTVENGGRPPVASNDLGARAPSGAREIPAPASAAPAESPRPGPVSVSAGAAPTGDPAEDAYMAGYNLWMAKRYPEAESALKAVVARYPTHKRASYAQNLLGRAYLDEGKPALAAEALYSNYRKMPRGERAPDSLYYLGQALTALKKPAEACKVYGELNDVYGQKINQALKDKVVAGRETAKCGA